MRTLDLLICGSYSGLKYGYLCGQNPNTDPTFAVTPSLFYSTYRPHICKSVVSILPEAIWGRTTFIYGGKMAQCFVFIAKDLVALCTLNRFFQSPVVETFSSAYPGDSIILVWRISEKNFEACLGLATHCVGEVILLSLQPFVNSFCQPCFLCHYTDRLELTAGQCRQLRTPWQLLNSD